MFSRISVIQSLKSAVAISEKRKYDNVSKTSQVIKTDSLSEISFHAMLTGKSELMTPQTSLIYHCF